MTTPDRPTPSLYLLGGVALRGVPEDSAERVLTQSKTVGLLACLALTPAGTFTRRDRLAGLLWPELDQSHARTALRKTLHLARSILGEDFIVSRGDEELTLPAGSLWCDATELRACIERGHLARAVELFTGELMPGFYLSECYDFDVWLEEQRASIREAAVAACWALAQHLESGKNLTEASHYAKKVTRLDKSNERLLRRSMQMLDRLGDRAGALSAYDEFKRRLRKELDADPSPETVRLAECIRTGQPWS
jgi:DNA-binding SARP family transcriptional activator